jgi:Tfp pilus assembly protein PilF/DNA-binding transcriptional regulator GbsR (MarR family)
MSLRVMKYNPGFATDEALKKTFVVRTHFLKWIVEILSGNTSDTNQHVLIIGPRGSGKTTLVRRVAVEIREDQNLQEQWYPIVFSEESYAITSVGEFWLEALKHLADQTNGERWQKTYEDLRRESDDRRLASRALSQLMDYADEQHKRIVLIIENLNMIFSEQLDKNADWEIRHALQNEKRLMLLGTATPHFDQIKDIQRGWFEFFAMYELEPLTTKECQTLWEALTGESLSELRIRPLQILTGGNPRLFSILAEFGAKMSLKELIDHLVELIDEYTEYFKSQLEILATTERKVFISVLEAWEPVTASQVSETSRMSTSQVSALLGRLVNRGAVTIVDPSTRKKLYQASERLFNIYFLMRNRNHPSNRVKAVVDFMVQFYEEEKLLKIANKIAEEACQENLFPQDNIFAFRQILSSIKPEMRAAIIKATPREFLAIPQISSFMEDSSFSRTIDQNYNIAHSRETILDHEALRDRLNTLEQNLQVKIKNKGEDSDSVAAILRQQANLYYKQFRYEKTEPLYTRSLMTYEKLLGSEHPSVATSLNNLARLYESQGKYEQAEPLYTRSLMIREKVLGSEHPDVATSLNNLAGLYQSQGKYEKAEPLYTRSLMIREKLLGSEHPSVATSLNNLARLYESQGKYEQTESLYTRSLMIYEKTLGSEHPSVAQSLNNLALLYQSQGKYEKAEPLYIRSLMIYEKTLGSEHPFTAVGLNRLGELYRKQEKYEQAEALLKQSRTTFEKALGMEHPYLASNLNEFAELYESKGQYEEAEPLYLQALEMRRKFFEESHPDISKTLRSLSRLYCKQGHPEKAEALLRNSIQKGNKNPQIACALINTLMKQDKWQEVFQELRVLLTTVTPEGDLIASLTDIFIDIAGAGYGKEAVEILKMGEVKETLKALIVGIQIYLGEQPIAAQEVLEIGKDVAQRIRQCKK